MAVFTETDTVIKRILPYLARRGYVIEDDIEFETATVRQDRYQKGYVDLLVTAGKPQPQFLIEAKRSSKTLTKSDAKQAIDYGVGHKVLFVILTNGRDIQAFNTATGAPIKWDGKLTDKIPTKDQLKTVIRALKANPTIDSVPLDGGEKSLPFRPGLPLKQLNSLFARCHNAIRKIEKNEESAFDDFSKLLFLKLLEEKADTTDFELPYSYRFHELAARPEAEADQVQSAVETMISNIKKKTPYGDVLVERLNLKNPKTFKYIVGELASVSFYDSSLDSKGAAFEYFVRATLKGKKLGQYFTPRPVVRLMNYMVGQKKIFASLSSGEDIKVFDPACGTGGFLVFLMQEALTHAQQALDAKLLTRSAFNGVTKRIMQTTFFGSDANEGVACAAKMNMIVAGDGHTNIRAEDSLAASAKNWSVATPDCDIVITNPPFGTSESDSLQGKDWDQFPLRTYQGQQLFLQKMVLSTKAGGDICTVIDDGLLNTASAQDLRTWLFRQAKIKAIVRLPEDTFKPNKINVRSSIVLMERWETEDHDLDREYPVTFIDVASLGYYGSGEPIRGFDLNSFLEEVSDKALKPSKKPRQGTDWSAFDVPMQEIKEDGSFRLDLKYWVPSVREEIKKLQSAPAKTIKELNQLETRRGRSPRADDYVDEKDGYAVVLKAGTSITKFGNVVESSDFIEKDIFDEMKELEILDGDILLASTGTGTLGKAGVFSLGRPAVADSHVTIIRVDPKVIDPFYLADYLRIGAGAHQIERLYTGSTGLIELTPEDVDRIIVDLSLSVDKQRAASKALRQAEDAYQAGLQSAEGSLTSARKLFAAKAAAGSAKEPA